jgi:uncharacterized protein with HEPN domain
MRQNNDLTYLGDILDAIQRIESYTTQVSKQGFIENFMMQDAIMLQIEIIGEATNSISESFQEKHDEIPWAQMRALRNRIVHDYRGINLNVIWDTVQNDLPALKRQAQDILGE